MCHRVACPNDGKPTWWGCGQHIESALAGVPESERCTCEHERVPYLPVMWRVKRKSTPAIEMGSSDDVDVVVSSAGNVVSIGMAEHRQGKGCTLNVELDLPRSIAPDVDNIKPSNIKVTSEDGGKMHTLGLSIAPPAAGVEIPVSASGDSVVFGLEGGNLRRQWVCPDHTTEMEDIHARLNVKIQQQQGFGLGGGNVEPTVVVAVLVLAWVVYSFVVGGGKDKRE